MDWRLEAVCPGEPRFIQGQGEMSLLEILRGIAPEYLSAPCGGKGRCGKCVLKVSGSLRPLKGGDWREFRQEAVRICEYIPRGECRVYLPEKKEALPEAAEDTQARGGRGLGLAVDIGSTNLEAALYELESGRALGRIRELNRQCAFGADVLNRIGAHRSATGSGPAEVLRAQIESLARRLLEAARADRESLSRAVFCGNTVMEHFAAGLDPAPIAVPPFTPVSLLGEGADFSAKMPWLGQAESYFCPCVSGYVGGDLVSGLSTVDTGGELCLYIDIGTNGEMALGNGESWLCCATAAGPAFEGAELKCGMGAKTGAICHVDYTGEDISFELIGGTEPEGICGSGVIDAVAVLLKAGVIGRSGRFEKAEKLPGPLAARLGRAQGQRAFYFSDRVFLSIEDIRNVQLAKAAIRAGAERLLMAGGKSPAELGKLVLAGGFGSYINVEKAMYIGLFPPLSPQQVKSAGNASLKGAAEALFPEGRKRMEATAKKCGYLDLSSDPLFPEYYLRYINFEKETET